MGRSARYVRAGAGRVARASRQPDAVNCGCRGAAARSGRSRSSPSAGRVRPLLTLSLDAATRIGTIALVSGPNVLADGEVEMRSAAGELLLPGIRRVLESA